MEDVAGTILEELLSFPGRSFVLDEEAQQFAALRNDSGGKRKLSNVCAVNPVSGERESRNIYLDFKECINCYNSSKASSKASRKV